MGDESTTEGHSIEEYRRGYEQERRLRGFRSQCGFTTVTWGLLCPQCGKRDLAEADLVGTGRVAAFSVQQVPSDEFLNDVPYAYVVVDLDGGGRITGWMPSVRSEAELTIGDRVRFVESYKSGVHFERDSKDMP
ncbi:MAG: OB-fold domain-containing protein [Thermoplasmata archaeon]|nr:OB-fold domain-containing protein [Thermoplasmata archaeon]